MGEFQLYPILYDNWLFLTLFLFPLKKKRVEENESEVANLFFFQDAFEIHLILNMNITYTFQWFFRPFFSFNVELDNLKKC